MAWRVHLTDDMIYRLDILQSDPAVLCVWVGGDRAVFFELANGVLLGHFSAEPPLAGVAERDTDDWRLFLGTLRGPYGGALPKVRTRRLTVHSTSDGGQRLYDDGHGLTVQIDGTEVPLGAADTHFITVAMDRVMGISAALDELGKLYIFQQHIPVGMFDIGLRPEGHILPDLTLADNAAAIFASDGARLVRVTSGGEVQKVRIAPYYINELACSRDGVVCITSDSEAGIIRAYTGDDLAFTHQKFAVDLYAAANPVQLLEDVASPRQAISAMTVGEGGVLAFAMEGIVTVTSLAAMEMMPRPQSLL